MFFPLMTSTCHFLGFFDFISKIRNILKAISRFLNFLRPFTTINYLIKWVPNIFNMALNILNLFDEYVAKTSVSSLLKETNIVSLFSS